MNYSRCLSISISIYPIIHQSSHLSIHSSIHPSIRPCINLNHTQHRSLRHTNEHPEMQRLISQQSYLCKLSKVHLKLYSSSFTVGGIESRIPLIVHKDTYPQNDIYHYIHIIPIIVIVINIIISFDFTQYYNHHQQHHHQKSSSLCTLSS